MFLKFPDTLRHGHRKRLVWYVRNAVRRSARLIAISESTKRDVCEWFDVSEDKIVVVPHGVDHSIFQPSDLPSPRPSPYIFSVGTLQPRKNFVMLIRAFKRLRELWREPIELLIAGQRGWMYEPIEQEAANTPGVHLLGYVADTELPALYAGAALVAMASLYEGFGLPLVEAMACGAPVVAADTPVFREVAADAAAWVNANAIEAWADTMRALLADNVRRQELRQLGLARAKTFSWERTAEQTVAVYRRAVQML